MRRIMMILTILVGLTACKKNENPTVQELLDKGVEISVILDDHPADSLLGKKLQGGWIFYVEEVEGAVRIVSDVDMSTQSVWGCAGNEINGADSTGIGYGRWNTDEIIAECPDANAAAGYCYYSNHGGFTDWVLPSAEELEAVYQNVHQKGIGNFSASGKYWTSSEVSATESYHFDFSNGNWEISNKTVFLPVRAVRKSDQ
ncbi:MAG: DUF1566 domain-containing protein [Crocinitomicaceae bacterium]